MKQTFKIALFLLFSTVVISAGSLASASTWEKSKLIFTGTPADSPSRPDVSSDGSLVVFISDNISSDTEEHIKIAEYSGGSWGAPVTVASNGRLDSGSTQLFYTQPAISGNGSVIAYMGYTQSSSKNEIYISDKSNTSWGTAYVLNTGLSNHHHWVCLSTDGNTIAYADYAFLEGSKLYVSTRSNGSWGPPVKVSTGESAVHEPSMNSDGTKLAWLQQYNLVFSELSGGSWSTPQVLTDSDGATSEIENPKITPDGSAIFYWKVTLVSTGSSYVKTSEDLFVIKRTSSGWDSPVKINPTSLIPNTAIDRPVASNSDGTRIVYSKGAVKNDTMYAASLQIAEYQNGSWTVSALTSTSNYYDISPKMTSDGKRLVYQGPDSYDNTSIWSKDVKSGSTTPATTTFSLKVSSRNGTVSGEGISCSGQGSDCTNTYDSGTEVTLTAEAATGYKFSGWAGCSSVSGSQCTVLMSKNRSVTAKFVALKKYTLKVAAQTGGNVTSDQSGIINCGGAGNKDCSEQYLEGTTNTIILTATPATNYSFTGWKGACTDTASTCTVTINNANKTVTAKFKKNKKT